jgi:hypothetical protein
LGHRRNRPGHLSRGPQQIINEAIDRTLHLAPGPIAAAHVGAVAGAALLANDFAHQGKFMGNALVGGGNTVETVGKLAVDASMIAPHAGRKIARLHGLQGIKELIDFRPLKFESGILGWAVAWRYGLQGLGNGLGCTPLHRSDIFHDHG